MFRYKLHTLLIMLAVVPPVLAGGWFLATQNLSLAVLTGFAIVPFLAGVVLYRYRLSTTPPWFGSALATLSALYTPLVLMMLANFESLPGGELQYLPGLPGWYYGGCFGGEPGAYVGTRAREVGVS